MRASAVRAAIRAAVESATPISKASRSDVFTYFQPGMRDVNMARDRVFLVQITTPPMRSKIVITTDLYECTWDVIVLYQDAPGVIDRLSTDTESVSQKLEGLAFDNAEIELVSIDGGSVGQTEGQIEVILNVRTVYRLTAGV